MISSINSTFLTVASLLSEARSATGPGAAATSWGQGGGGQDVVAAPGRQLLPGVKAVEGKTW